MRVPGDKSDIELVGAFSPPSVFNTLGGAGGNAADASGGSGCGLGDAAKPGNKGGAGLVATAVSSECSDAEMRSLPVVELRITTKTSIWSDKWFG